MTTTYKSEITGNTYSGKLSYYYNCNDDCTQLYIGDALVQEIAGCLNREEVDEYFNEYYPEQLEIPTEKVRDFFSTKNIGIEDFQTREDLEDWLVDYARESGEFNQETLEKADWEEIGYDFCEHGFFEEDKNKNYNFKQWLEKTVCPCCGSTNISETDVDYDTDYGTDSYFRDWSCSSCRAEWSEKYKLSEISAEEGEYREVIHNEDIAMLERENKAMAEFLASLGYTNEEISNIANQ